jgi:hypothetical protein
VRFAGFVLTAASRPRRLGHWAHYWPFRPLIGQLRQFLGQDKEGIPPMWKLTNRKVVKNACTLIITIMIIIPYK